jgi:restriction system protein
VADNASGGARRNLGWQDFELLVGEAFRMGGYAVTETDGFVLGLQCFSEMPRFAD